MSDENRPDVAQPQVVEAPPSPEPALAAPSNKSRIPLLIALGVAVLLVVGGGLWWRNFTRSPGYSLGQLAKAAQDKDWDGVQKYVDIDAVVDQLMGVAVSQAMEEDDSGFGALAAGLFESMKPALAKQVKDGLRESIEQGDGEGKSGPSALAGVFAADKVDKITYIGDEALVSVRIPDDKDESTDLKLRMKRVDDFWRITAIENIEDLADDALPQ